MSIDFNSIINSAFDSANRQQSVAAGVVDSVFNPGGVAKSTPGGLSELSIEDIASAVKSRGAKKSEENKFVERHTVSTFERKDKKEEGNFSVNNSVVGRAQDAINAIQASADVSLLRQNQIADNLRKTTSNPFTK